MEAGLPEPTGVGGKHARSQAAGGRIGACWAAAAAADEGEEDGTAGSPRRPFDSSMVAGGLSELGRTASGGSAAFLRLDLSGTTLADPQALAHCAHVQHARLSRNQLTTLRGLGRLRRLVTLDASRNQLAQVLDLCAGHGGGGGGGGCCCCSSLQSADLSHNSIAMVGDLPGGCFSKLARLALDHNQIEHLGSGLGRLGSLTCLSLSGNRLASCRGLEGLTGLRELAVDGNRLETLAPLRGLPGLEVLLAARNSLRSCDVQGLLSLRRLDVSGNLLPRLEVLAPCRGLSLLTELDARANPLEAAQSAQRFLVALIPQLGRLNGAPLSSSDKVDAANACGASAEALMRIRRQHFGGGELDDGGGAALSMAAGLVASHAEEERACCSAEDMFDAIASWAAVVPPGAALGAACGSTSSAPALSPEGSAAASGSSSGGGLASGRASGGRIPRSSSSARRAAQSATGAAAVAARLAAGCAAEAPWRQLHLGFACYAWVLRHVRLPHGCSAEAGADATTWVAGQHLFGEDDRGLLLHQALLLGHSGTWAECVSQLLVMLVRACGMEAAQIPGFWKAGGASLAPGRRLAAHNASWAAVKVNGRWRLLDPVGAIVRDGPLPFFSPPEAFIHTHLPLEAQWQLLPSPVSMDEWWQRPELSMGFCAAGGLLLGPASLRACNTLAPAEQAGGSPAPLRITLAAPASSEHFVSASLLGAGGQLLASWQLSNGGGDEMHDSSSRGGPSGEQQQQQQQQAPDAPSLIYQQPATLRAEAGAAPAVLVGHHLQWEVVPQEVWVALPGPGSFCVQVDMVRQTKGWLALAVDGLAAPLELSRWQREAALRVQVVVPQAPACGKGACQGGADAAPAGLPVPQQPGWASVAAAGGFALLQPPPGAPLEADRRCEFEVIAPGAATVAVGCGGQGGWTELQLEQPAPVGGGAPEEAHTGRFRGEAVLPRAQTCFVAVRLQDGSGCSGGGGSCASGGSSGEASAGWLKVVGLHVRQQVQTMVCTSGWPGKPPEAFDTRSTAAVRAEQLLAALDADGDGAVSRRDMLRALRRDRQLADHLRMPPCIRAGDGSFDQFLARFSAINQSGLGLVDLEQLAAYLTALPASL